MCSTDNNFSLSITDAAGRLCDHLTSEEKKNRGIDEKHNYVKVVDGSNITIMFENRRQTAADVTLLFEGKRMGLYRVPAESKFEVKRPSNSDQGFFIHAETTRAAASAGVEVDRKENGLIEARIVFAKVQQQPPKSDFMIVSGAAKGCKFEHERIDSLVETSQPVFRSGTRGIPQMMFLESQPIAIRSVVSQPVPVKAAAITLGAPTGQNFNSCPALTDIDAAQSRVLLLRVLAIPSTKEVNSEGQTAVAKLPVRPATPPRIES